MVGDDGENFEDIFSMMLSSWPSEAPGPRAGEAAATQAASNAALPDPQRFLLQLAASPLRLEALGLLREAPWWAAAASTGPPPTICDSDPECMLADRAPRDTEMASLHAAMAAAVDAARAAPPAEAARFCAAVEGAGLGRWLRGWRPGGDGPQGTKRPRVLKEDEEADRQWLEEHEERWRELEEAAEATREFEDSEQALADDDAEEAEARRRRSADAGPLVREARDRSPGSPERPPPSKVAAAFGLLDVSLTATAKEVERQYRLLARRHHPDKAPQHFRPQASQRFRELQDAKATALSWLQRRQQPEDSDGDDSAEDSFGLEGDGEGHDGGVYDSTRHCAASTPSESEKVTSITSATVPDAARGSVPPRRADMKISTSPRGAADDATVAGGTYWKADAAAVAAGPVNYGEVYATMQPGATATGNNGGSTAASSQGLTLSPRALQEAVASIAQSTMRATVPDLARETMRGVSVAQGDRPEPRDGQEFDPWDAGLSKASGADADQPNAVETAAARDEDGWRKQGAGGEWEKQRWWRPGSEETGNDDGWRWDANADVPVWRRSEKFIKLFDWNMQARFEDITDYELTKDEDFYDEDAEEDEELDIEAVLAEIDDMDLAEDQATVKFRMVKVISLENLDDEISDQEIQAVQGMTPEQIQQLVALTAGQISGNTMTSTETVDALMEPPVQQLGPAMATVPLALEQQQQPRRWQRQRR
ncbi:unnamed protein product [Prorocentrum cordatum]|uniref:J domain-containing protein n=1 Tax=Prorocentrum cordatum TaxID=2364126 RepID=A0ABN9SAL8_9DINO|nr:unnamed protein product [Polarella glacialis]